MKRIASVLFILVLLVCSVSAAEMYNPAKKWYSSGNGKAYIKQYEYDLNNNCRPSYVYPDASISSGYFLWEANTQIGIRVVNESVSTMNVSGRIVHLVPTRSGWDGLWDTDDQRRYYVALTHNCDTNSVQITTLNAGQTTDYIANANIYYQHSDYGNLDYYSTSQFSSLIAHEMGHVLGFGHVDTDTTSIMHPSSAASGLNNNDKSALASKYPNA